MKASYAKYRLDFRFTAITSRDRMQHKDTFFIKIWDDDSSHFGIGEAALFRGLSCDDTPGYEEKLMDVCRNIDCYLSNPGLLDAYPSIRMGIETAFHDFRNGCARQVFPSAWSAGENSVTINGLIWMGDKSLMAERLRQKVDEGFKCIKLKIGGIDFEDELDLLKLVRSLCPYVELRLDANGAFTPENAMERLMRLSEFRIHSIEQPIRQGQWEKMARLCSESPIPIALDEELIGLNASGIKEKMLDMVQPQYIILKPTLCGGFLGSDQWIELADRRGIGWWATSALESNIGLNAIAQWVAAKEPQLPQGLGTGQLYFNNITSPLTLHADRLVYAADKAWEIPDMEWMEC